MSEVIKELEHVLKVVENDIKYYDRKQAQAVRNEFGETTEGFYRGGKEALTDMKKYLEKEIKRIKITDKFDKNEKVS